MVAIIDIVLVFVYIAICFLIGYLASRKERASEFIIADRKLSTGRFMATYVASSLGGGMLVGYAAFVYKFGISAAWAIIGYCAMIVLFIFYSKKLRSMSKKENWHTLPDFFYAKHGTTVGVTVTWLIILTSFLYLIGQLIAGAIVLGVVTGWSYLFCLLLGTVVVLVYLLLGGFNAVVSTDVFQYLLMLFITAIIGISFVKGTIFIPEQLAPLGAGWGVVIGLTLYGILLVIVSPELWQRVYAAKDDRVLRVGTIASSFFIFLITVGLTLIVMATRAKFPNLVPEQSLAYGFVNVLPPLALGFGLVLLFATIMSSADTLIFTLSTILSKNVFRRKLRERTYRKSIRKSIIFVTLVAAVLAYIFPDIIQIYTIIANVVFSLAPAAVASFHWDIKPKAILLSIGAGIATLLLFVVLGVLTVEISALSFLMAVIFLFFGQFVFRHKA